MTLGIRKLIVLALIAAVFLLGNAWLVAGWLDHVGVIDLAKHVRAEYLTGTAITVIVVLLVLLARPTADRRHLVSRCPVCERILVGSANYCGHCGSKVA